MMYQPSPYLRSSIQRPSCPHCGHQMWLSRIEPAEPDHDQRTFECPNCQHVKAEVLRFK